MAKTKTTTKTSSTETTTPASTTSATTTPVAEVAASSETPVAAKAPRTKKAKATTEPAAEAPVVVAAAAAPVQSTSSTEEVAASSSSDAEVPALDQSIDFVAKLQQVSLLLSSLKVEYRMMERRWARELKAAQKQSSRRKRKASNRAPSGFVKPTLISDALADFLGRERGTQMARTAVTHDINTYIREHNLQNSSNGRIINPDQKLSTLLNLTGAEELTYFNLQRFMSPHFAKSVKASDSATATA